MKKRLIHVLNKVFLSAFLLFSDAAIPFLQVNAEIPPYEDPISEPVPVFSAEESEEPELIEETVPEEEPDNVTEDIPEETPVLSEEEPETVIEGDIEEVNEEQQEEESESVLLSNDPVPAGSIVSNTIEGVEEALPGAQAEYSDGILTVTLTEDVVLSSPLRLKQGDKGNTIVVNLNGHTIKGPDGQAGTDNDTACGQSAVIFETDEFNLEICGPGSIIGGNGAIYEDAESGFREGRDGGAAVYLIRGDKNFDLSGGDDLGYNPDELGTSLRVNGGAVLAGGDGANASYEDWLHNVNLDRGGDTRYLIHAGKGGMGIDQVYHSHYLSDVLQDRVFLKLLIENGTVSGGHGGCVSADNHPFTYSELMKLPVLRGKVEALTGGENYDSVFGGIRLRPADGGSGIRIYSGRKYVEVGADSTVLGGAGGYTDYGPDGRRVSHTGDGSLMSMLHNLGDGGHGIEVRGDIGLTNQSANTAGEACEAEYVGIRVYGNVQGGDTHDVSALDFSATNAGSGIVALQNSRYEGSYKYQNYSVFNETGDYAGLAPFDDAWGTIRIESGGFVAGGNGGSAVSGLAGGGGDGISGAPLEALSDSGSVSWIDVEAGGEVRGGTGGDCSSFDITTAGTVPQYSVGTGGAGINMNDEGTGLTGSGTVRAGDCGTITHRDAFTKGQYDSYDGVVSDKEGYLLSGENRMNTSAVYNIRTEDITGSLTLLDGGYAKVRTEQKDGFRVSALMTPFTSAPTADTELSCEVQTPEGYEGEVYLRWCAVIKTGDNWEVTNDFANNELYIEGFGTENQCFRLHSDSDYPNLYNALTYYYRYETVTAERIAERIRYNDNTKVTIYCYAMLEDGSLAKSNEIWFTKSTRSPTGWSGGSGGGGETIPVTSLNVRPASARLCVGEELLLTAAVEPEDATYQGVNWTSSNPSVAEVNEFGLVTALAPGTAQIIAAAADGSGYMDSCNLTVEEPKPVPVSGIRILDEEGTVLKESETLILYESDEEGIWLEAELLPLNTTEAAEIIWTSSDESAAAVEDGHIMPAGAGTAVIKASAEKPDGTVVSASVRVKVLPDLTCMTIEAEPGSLTLHEGETRNVSVRILKDGQEPSDTVREWLRYELSAQMAEGQSGILSCSDRMSSKSEITVTGLKSGSAEISIQVYTSEQEPEDGASVTIPVTVIPRSVTLYDDKGLEAGTLVPVPGQKLSNLPSLPEKEADADGTSYLPMGWYTGPEGKGILVTNATLFKEDLFAGEWALYAWYLPVSAEEQASEVFTVRPIADEVYTGAKITPAVQVYCGGRLLTAGKDYTVKYEKNVNASPAVIDGAVNPDAPKAIITGKGNYKDKRSIPFTILPKDLSEEDVTDNAQALVRTVSVKKGLNIMQKPSVTLKYGKLTLSAKKNRDYIIEYPDTDRVLDDGTVLRAYADEGVWMIRVKGQGNYTGTREIPLRLVKNRKLIGKLKITLSGKSFDYTGDPVIAPVTVKDGKQVLRAGEDYVLAYENNVAPGTAKVNVTMVSDAYAGSRTLTYTIKGRAVKNIRYENLTGLAYTGEPVMHTGLSLKYKNGKVWEYLAEGEDYELVYADHINAGTASVTIIGKGMYQGTIRKTFRILPYALTGKRIRIADDGFETVYTKGGAKYMPEIRFYNEDSDGYRILQEGTDYTLSYKNHNFVGTKDQAKNPPTVTVRGKGNFKGTLKLTYDILPAELSAERVEVYAPDPVWNTKAGSWKSAPVVTDRSSGVKLKAGTDYTVKYYVEDRELTASDCLPAGSVVTARIFAVTPKSGKQNYIDAEQNAFCTYTVTEEDRNIGRTGKFRIRDMVYSGEELFPSQEDFLQAQRIPYKNAAPVELTLGQDNGDGTFSGDFVIVSITKNITKGTAKVTFRGVNSCTGEKTAAFRIVQKSIRE